MLFSGVDFVDNIQFEIYNYLLKIDKLNSNIYLMLINKYGEKIVNFVIEKMIDMKVNINKFDYYIERIISNDDDFVNDDLFTVYLNDMNKIDMLSTSENNALAKDIYELICKIDELIGFIDLIWVSDRIDEYIKICNDTNKIREIKILYREFLDKRNKLVDANLRFVVCISRSFYRNNRDFNDIVQFGNIGLMKAIEKFDPKYNTNFSTYAYYWIKQNISKNISDLEMTVRVPYNLHSLNSLMKKMIRLYINENGCGPTDLEIADKLNVSLKKIKNLKLLFSEPVSIYSSINKSYEVNETAKMIDFIEDKNCLVEEQILNDCLCNEMNKILNDCLTEQEYYIISHRYGVGKAEFMTLVELGKELGITAERVRQMENKIKIKLKKECKNLYVYLT